MSISSGIGWFGLALLAVGCGAPRPLEHAATHTEPLSWAVQQIDDPPAAQSDLFGYGLAISGDTSLVGALELGAPGAPAGLEHGAVYAFTRQTGGWQQQGPALTADDGSDYDNFGQRIAVDGDMALIGAYYKSIYPGTAASGGVYVFTRSAGVWTQHGPAFAPTGARGFGESISISGNTALIGADFSSAVYTYTRSGNTWTQQGSALSASDSAAFDYFGFALQLVGDTALVGAFDHDVAGVVRQGTAYVFSRNGTGWTQQAELMRAAGELDDSFGVAVALSADASTAVIGADGVNSAQGAVYVYTRSGATWTQQGDPLTAPTPTANDHFGRAVAIQGDTIWIAAPGGHGTLYRFTRTAGAWSLQTPVLQPPASTTTNDFGRYMVASGNTVWVSDPYGHAASGSSQQGEAYVFSLDVGTPCGAASDCQTGYCADGVCCDQPCAGNCDVCALALGAAADGTCSVAPAGYLGKPVCAASCDGVNTGCPVVVDAGAGSGGAAGDAGASGASTEAGAGGLSDTGSGGVADPGSGGVGVHGAGDGGVSTTSGSAGVGASGGGAAGTGGPGAGGSAAGSSSGAAANGGSRAAGGANGSSNGGSSLSSGGPAASGGSGCGCTVAGQRRHDAALWLMLGVIGCCVRKRRRACARRSASVESAESD